MKSLNTALVTMRRTPYQSLAAIVMLSITFFVAYGFSFFAYSSEQVLQFFERRPQVIAFFEISASTDQVDAAAAAMKEKSYVESVQVVSKDQALELYRQNNQDDPLLLELVSADILPASVEVSGKNIEDLSQIKKDLQSFSGVDDVDLPEDILAALDFWTHSLRITGLAIIAVLAVESLLIILIITSMKVTSKRQAIAIMDILGASNWFISGPFVYEGMLYGIIGSLIGWSATTIGILYATPWLKEIITPIPLFPIPLEFFAIQLGVGTLVGILFGAFASSLSVKRAIRK